MHPLLGWLATAAVVILFFLGVMNDRWTRGPTIEAGQLQSKAQGGAETALRNAEAVQAMGMLPALLYRWNRTNREALSISLKAGDRGSVVMGLGKFIRMVVQISILAVGAYLVISTGKLASTNPNTAAFTGGMMIAASILLGRALAPVEQALGGWKGLVATWNSYNKLNNLQRVMPDPTQGGMALPEPKAHLVGRSVSFIASGTNKPILRNVSIEVKPGEVIGIVGPSAAGKSTLCRIIMGILPPTHGDMRLDGSETSRWQRDDFGQYVGYLPQDIEIFAGTVSENISRMAPAANPENIIAAARLAGVDHLIRSLPHAYDTPIGEGGVPISGGQRQRIGLARALYGNPRLLVLDEPNASLDAEGEDALENAISASKKSGAAIILVAHKPSILMQADKVLVLRDGMMEMFDDRDTVLGKLLGPKFNPNQRRQVSSNVTPKSSVKPKAPKKTKAKPKTQATAQKTPKAKEEDPKANKDTPVTPPTTPETPPKNRQFVVSPEGVKEVEKAKIIEEESIENLEADFEIPTTDDSGITPQSRPIARSIAEQIENIVHQDDHVPYHPEDHRHTHQDENFNEVDFDRSDEKAIKFVPPEENEKLEETHADIEIEPAQQTIEADKKDKKEATAIDPLDLLFADDGDDDDK